VSASRTADHSRCPKTYSARSNTGRRSPRARAVFQPTWSKRTCVQTTESMLAGGKPASVRRRRYGDAGSPCSGRCPCRPGFAGPGSRRRTADHQRHLALGVELGRAQPLPVPRPALGAGQRDELLDRQPVGHFFDPGDPGVTDPPARRGRRRGPVIRAHPPQPLATSGRRAVGGSATATAALLSEWPRSCARPAGPTCTGSTMAHLTARVPTSDVQLPEVRAPSP